MLGARTGNDEFRMSPSSYLIFSSAEPPGSRAILLGRGDSCLFHFLNNTSRLDWLLAPYWRRGLRTVNLCPDSMLPGNYFYLRIGKTDAKTSANADLPGNSSFTRETSHGNFWKFALYWGLRSFGNSKLGLNCPRRFSYAEQ